MPFTPAHAAIVLPFLRKQKCSATGLIVGSVAPDFEYFFKMSVSGQHSHTLAGLLYFDLPVVIMLSLVFHQIVKRNLIFNLPYFFQKRFYDTLHLDFIQYLKDHKVIFIISALLGSASHLFWDSFTHGAGFMVRLLPFYKGSYVPFQGVNYPLWYALQHISTAIGLTLVLLYIGFKKTSAYHEPCKPNWRYWVLLLFMTVTIVCMRFAIKSSDLEIGNLVVTSISALVLSLIVCGFISFGCPSPRR